eukprot:491957_1
MINRFYTYSISLNYCRFCNELQPSREEQNPNQKEFNMETAYHQRFVKDEDEDEIRNELIQVKKKHNVDSNLKNTNNTKYPVFYTAPDIRYLSTNPKYASFAQEILLNDMCWLEEKEWNKHLNDAKTLYEEYAKTSKELQ